MLGRLGRAAPQQQRHLWGFRVSVLLSASQLAELAQMPSTEPRDASQLASERMEILMAEIRALGHIPREAHENALYHRVRHAKSQNVLSESQLAELAELSESNILEVRRARMDTLMAEIRALGHIPRARGAEDALCQRLCYAKRKRQLSESQLAELAQLPGPRSKEAALRAARSASAQRLSLIHI